MFNDKYISKACEVFEVISISSENACNSASYRSAKQKTKWKQKHKIYERVTVSRTEFTSPKVCRIKLMRKLKKFVRKARVP